MFRVLIRRSVAVKHISPLHSKFTRPIVRLLTIMPSKTDDTYTGPELRGDTKKQDESREGKQYVLSPSKGNARKHASGKNEKDDSKEDATSQRTDYTSAMNCTEHWEHPEHLEKNLAAYKKFQEHNRQSAKDDKKRGTATKEDSPHKKQKTSGGKQDKPDAPAGSITRVPKQGQKVQWHSLPGYVDGEVVEVVYEEKEVDGKKIKASKEDPRIVLKSDSSGKICVHKPDVVYFD